MLVLLDRDGVINRDLPRGVCAPEEFEYIPRSVAAIAELKKAGHTLCVTTNQSAVGKGWMTQATLDAIHASMLRDVRDAGGDIARIYAATEAPDTPSFRRKPAPGMLLEAMRDFDFPPSGSIMVCDALTDLIAASEAGCRAILVRTGKGLATQAMDAYADVAPIAVCDDLWEAHKVIQAL